MTQLVERLLQLSESGGENVTILGIALALIVSTACAGMAQLLYRFFYEDYETGSQIDRSFLLIGPSITVLFIAVRLSLPLSLGLLGALSIVRFRVPIREPEEVGFLMVVVASAIACATYNYVLLALLFATVILALLLRWYLAGRVTGLGRRGGLFLITVPDDAYGQHGTEIEAVLQKRVGRIRLEHLTGKDGLTTLNYAFSGRAGIDWGLVRTELTGLCRPEAMSVVLSRPGGI